MTTRKGATTEEQDLNTQETADDAAEEEYVPALVLGAPLTRTAFLREVDKDVDYASLVARAMAHQRRLVMSIGPRGACCRPERRSIAAGGASGRCFQRRTTLPGRRCDARSTFLSKFRIGMPGTKENGAFEGLFQSERAV